MPSSKPLTALKLSQQALDAINQNDVTFGARAFERTDAAKCSVDREGLKVILPSFFT